MEVIEQRKTASTQQSYTATLLAGGITTIGAKVREEADELIEAAAEEGETGQQYLAQEAADVIYHLFVMLAARGVALSDVEAVLEQRFGTSGLAERPKLHRAK